MYVETEVRAEARAERLLAEYLRAWGLRCPTAIAERCRLWSQQAADGDSNVHDAAIRIAAVTQAMDEFDRWLDQLALMVSPHQAEAEQRRGLLALALQKLIDQYPQSLLETDNLSETLLRQLQRAAQPVVPPIRATQMHSQPLGELPPPLQRQWWRRVFNRVAGLFLNSVNLKRGS